MTEIKTFQMDVRSKLNFFGKSFIGTREYQQDRMSIFETERYRIAVVCDGMGGMEYGEKASQLAIDILKEDIPLQLGDKDIHRFLNKEIEKINGEVCKIVDNSGRHIDTGSTIVMVAETYGKMFYFSVGDSRVYRITESSIEQLTKDHNYKMRLDAKLAANLISREMYDKEMKRGEALISYLGVGKELLIDANYECLRLNKSDCILLCSDGLYKALPPEDILNIVNRNRDRIHLVPDILIETAMDHSPRGMDNTTIVIGLYE